METLIHIRLTVALATGENSVQFRSHVKRITKAMNYVNRSGVTTLNVRGTTLLLPAARGKATVQTRQGYV